MRVLLHDLFVFGFGQGGDFSLLHEMGCALPRGTEAEEEILREPASWQPDAKIVCRSCDVVSCAGDG